MPNTIRVKMWMNEWNIAKITATMNNVCDDNDDTGDGNNSGDDDDEDDKEDNDDDNDDCDDEKRIVVEMIASLCS